MMIELVDETDSPRAVALADLERDVISAAVAWNETNYEQTYFGEVKLSELGDACDALTAARDANHVKLRSQED